MFTQLMTRTTYSLLNSLVDIPTYVARAKKEKATALGIMDKGVLHGAIEFYKACRKEKIKPIIGVTLEYFSAEVNKNFTLSLIAKNNLGYQQMMKLSSQQKIKEQIQLADILPHLEHLAVIFDEGSELFFYARENFQHLGVWLKQFSEEIDQYVGISANIEPYLFNVIEQLQLRPLALREVLYFEPEEVRSLQVARAILSQEVLEPASMEVFGESSYLNNAKTTELFEKQGLFSALENLEKLVEEIQLDIPLHQTLLPHFPLKSEENAREYLEQLAFSKLEYIVPNATKEYHERLKMELDIIHEMGFDDYFLIVWDLLRFAHEEHIFTGSGRGSAAGSLVAYVLEITGVDPIRYDLLFERFLNKERYTMPDIDIDIPDDKREELLRYVAEKYGRKHVAQIATFQTLGAKQALRDVTRVFGLSMRESDEWSRAVGSEFKITLQSAYDKSKRLRDLVEKNTRNTLIFAIAKRLEGVPRNVSTHAAGVVMSDKNLFDLIPLQTGSETIYLTQFDMYGVEDVGLLKMDFLGLKNLKIIADALRSILKTYKENLNIKTINFLDEKTLELFRKGNTTGIFQFESLGIRQVLRKVSPDTIEDIAAVNALYRPGPMQNIDHFAARKHGRETIVYPDERLAPILQNTYGVLVYQEQVMQALVEMAGFTLGEADIVRRAIGKKKRDVIDTERQNFLTGAMKNGVAENVAEEVYDYIEKFANYGFNRSHAFAYSFVAYQMAYLKVHYSGAFFQSLMHSNRGSKRKIREYVGEAKRYGVESLLPDINQSQYSFRLLSPNEIQFGFSEIKGLRSDFIREVLAERQQAGAFRSVDDFLLRIPKKYLTDENMESLIYSGTFDKLEQNRQKLLIEVKRKIEKIKLFGGMDDLFWQYEVKEEAMPDFSPEIRLEKEEETLGIFLSNHPTELLTRLRKEKKTKAINEVFIGDVVRMIVQVKSVKEIRTKKNEAMAFIEAQDTTGEIEVTIFPKIYRKVYPLLEKGMILYIEGKGAENKFSQGVQVLADNIQNAHEMEQNIPTENLFLRVLDEEKIPQLKEELLQFSGNIPVILVVGETRNTIALNERFSVKKSLELEEKLSISLGSESFAFVERK
ncbi:DNA polymerase-3 subunit alpha [Pilibacter termitis]|uniref:DNA polymerase III subunit alpha n=1 Tax=Pilibacter termitis TaxID=263852 RepID=A0A1T4PBX8_9ENTE|nr:DNA polymerase III subunit alpha [Pilibacter termitis]SJZ89053.1 DNA polymerase-3 subunit alpha [Pilibacter termitis]